MEKGETERIQLQVALKEKEKKEIEQAARIAELEQMLLKH
jgi:hypothetical protein